MLYINRRGAAREDISKEVQYKEALLREIPIKLLLILKTYGIPESTPPQIGGVNAYILYFSYSLVDKGNMKK